MNKNKMIAAFLVVIMVCTMLVVPVTAAETNNVVYTINLEAVDETTWQIASRDVAFWLGDGSKKIVITSRDKDGLGSPVVCDWPVYETVDGVTRKTNRTMGITYIPLRRVANALSDMGCSVEWFSEDGGYAILTCGRGHVKLRAGAAYAEVVETGEQLGDTSAYTMPDNKTPAPIILSRKGRLYVSARALANLIMEDPVLRWNKTTLNISGKLIGGAQNTNKDWVGVWNPETPFMEDMVNLPHIAAAIEETNASTTKRGNDSYMTVRPADAETTEYIFLSKVDGGIRIAGLQNYVGHRYESENPGYLKIIKGILDDFISDPQDIKSVYDTIVYLQNNGTVGFQDGPQEFNTIIVDWLITEYGSLSDMRIYNK